MEEQPQNIEKELNKYVYKDYSQNGEVVFECVAKDILEADQNIMKQREQMSLGRLILDVLLKR